MSRAVALAALAALVAVAGAAAAVATAAPAAAEGEGAAILRQVAEASTHLSYTGVVRVRWVDGDGAEHAVDAPVQAEGGVVQVGAADHPLRWAPPAASARPAPDPTAKYDVAVADGPEVLGRATTRLLLAVAGRLVEEADVDPSTGIVLRRSLVDASGRAVRTVELTGLDGVHRAAPAAAAQAALGAVGGTPKLPWRAPSRLPGGYVELGAYRRGPAVQVVYGDGLHTVSVFGQPGVADGHHLPMGGQPVAIGGATGRRWSWAGGQVVAWSQRGATTTVVGDGPADEVLAAARAVPMPSRPRTLSLARLRRVCRAVVRLVG